MLHTTSCLCLCVCTVEFALLCARLLGPDALPDYLHKVIFTAHVWYFCSVAFFLRIELPSVALFFPCVLLTMELRMLLFCRSNFVVLAVAFVGSFCFSRVLCSSLPVLAVLCAVVIHKHVARFLFSSTDSHFVHCCSVRDLRCCSFHFDLKQIDVLFAAHCCVLFCLLCHILQTLAVLLLSWRLVIRFSCSPFSVPYSAFDVVDWSKRECSFLIVSSVVRCVDAKRRSTGLHSPLDSAGPLTTSMDSAAGTRTATSATSTTTNAATTESKAGQTNATATANRGCDCRASAGGCRTRAAA